MKTRFGIELTKVEENAYQVIKKLIANAEPPVLSDDGDRLMTFAIWHRCSAYFRYFFKE
jgi:hypothetical protein